MKKESSWIGTKDSKIHENLVVFPFLLPDNDKNQGRLLHNECIKVGYADPGHLDEADG